ncbi:sensor histidine kinase [Embleya sp. AB8]|uniref:sensor histidine kinase n=1 Tax=Embleya sp. AB8 TaxID=3156304 RepID=UPI003C78C143
MHSEPRPPLSKRLRPGHWIVLDVLVATVCLPLVQTSAGAHYGAQQLPGWRLLVLVLPVAFVLRRRHPFVGLAAALALAGLMALDGKWSQGEGVVIVTLALILYSVAATKSPRTSVRCLLIGAVPALGEYVRAVTGHAPGRAYGYASGGALFSLMVLLVAWVVGYAVGRNRAYAAGVRAYQEGRAALLVERSVAEERLRIARELHDVVAHTMSVVAVQAGYGHHVIDRQPAEARAALAVIATTSRDSLVEMRRLLGVLREGSSGPGARSDDGDALRPAPGLADLGRLTERMAQAGVRVSVRAIGRVRPLSASVDLCAYRIVQEALTNVAKHAGTSTGRVTLDYREDELAIEVLDDGRGCAAPVPGHGLIGMRERVGLHDGWFSAEALPGRGFRVAAGLPFEGSAVAAR